MVALKAELGPRDAPGTVAWTGGVGQPAIQIPVPIRPGYDVFVAAGSDALPGTGTPLGTFNHNEGSDPLYTLNHAVVDHIRGLIYAREANAPANTTPPPTGWVNPGNYPPPESLPKYTGPTPGSMFPVNFNDLQIMRIKRHGATMLATSLTAAGVSMAVAATATIVVKAQPGDTAVANADCIFASNSDAIATVAATGVVTGKAPGNTFVRVTNKFNGLIVDVPVTVTGAGVFGFGTGDESGQQSEPQQQQLLSIKGEPQAQSFVVSKTDEPGSPDEPEDEVPEDAPEDDEVIDEAEDAEEEEVSVGEIAGIGPATEAKLAEVGITTARQIAELSEDEADKLDDELGLGGRIRRDDWVGQAKELIA